jgi:transposase
VHSRPAERGFVGGLRPWDLPSKRHPSFAASIFYRFRIFTLLEHGYLQASHNRVERELRSLVLGRKNWLFAYGDLGGERTATILTIVGTCIAQRINPRAYLHAVTELIVNGWPNARLRELLPDRIGEHHPELRLPSGASPPPALPAAA